MWEAVQIKLKENRRNKEHTQERNKYTGLLIFSKCGCNLRRRGWNSGKPCQKVVWQCGNYIKNGKDACSGTSIAKEALNKLNIKEETIIEEHSIKKLDTTIPFWGKCGTSYSRKTWMQPDGTKRKVWMCSNRYKEKGVKGCDSKHIYEEILQGAFVEVFNTLVDNKQHFLEKWKGEVDEVDGLKRYRLKAFIKILEQGEKQEQFNEKICLKMLEQIKVIGGKRQLIVTMLDGSSMECEVE